MKMTRRNRNIKKSTRTLWIFCEGHTEERYFKNLKFNERLRIKSRLARRSSPDSIVEKAIRFLENGGEFESGDLICCV